MQYGSPPRGETPDKPGRAVDNAGMKKTHQTRYKKPTQQFDVRVFIEPEDERTEALYTLSAGKKAICVSSPLRVAAERFRRYLEEQTEEP